MQTKSCSHNILWPVCLNVAKFDTMIIPRPYSFLIAFQIMWLYKTVSLCTTIVRSIYSDLYFSIVPKLDTVWLPPDKRCSPVIFGSNGRRSKVNVFVFVQIMSSQYLLTPLPWSFKTWYSSCPQRVDDFPNHMAIG